MTAFDRLLDDLRRLADRARAGVREEVGYRFGARTIAVRTRDPRDPALPVGALPPASPEGAGATVQLLDRSDVAGLRLDPREPLGPYGAVRASAESGWLVVTDPEHGKVLALDRQTREALYFPGARVPPRDRAEFLRPLLHWLAILDGSVVVHAGGVARDGRGILVAGTGNAGKSTLVRAALADGWAVLGDNVVEVVPQPGGGSRLVGVYGTFKTRPHPVVPVDPAWPPAEWDDEAVKHIHFATDALGDGFAAEPVAHAATLVLDEHAPPAVRPLGSAAGLLKVAPNTVAQFPFFELEALRRTGAILGGAPLLTSGRLPPAEIGERLADLLGAGVPDAR